MRRAFFFIVATFFAATSFASIPRASMLDRASSILDPLPETRVWASDVLAPFERQPTSELTRALHQAYGEVSTTSASGLGRFLSVDPGRDWDLRRPQSWNMYSYVRNNPINRTDPNGRYTCSGTGDECKAWEASLSIVRAAANEANRQKLEGADKLNKIVALYGKPGEKNGVAVNFGATKLKTLMEATVSANGNVAIAVNSQIFGQELAARQYVSIATGVAHEADHGLAGRANPETRNTNSRSILMQHEVSAYRAGGYIYQSLGFSDTHQAIWQVDGGWTPLLEHYAKQSVDAECVDRGCSP